MQTPGTRDTDTKNQVMKESLDLTEKEFKQLLDKSIELILNEYKRADNKKAYHDHPQSEIEAWFNEDLPLEGMDNDVLLTEIRNKIMDTATNNLGPHMYAYVMSGGNQVSTIAELIAATLDQNPTKWHLAPAMNEIEKRVISWAAQMIDYSPKAGGILVSGGSAANLTGLTVARNVFFEKENIQENGLFNNRPFIVYASEQVHSCIDKSVQLLGIGTKQLRKIKTKEDFTIDTDELIRQIEKDISNNLIPFCIVGTAGTVNTGAIDDMKRLSAIAKRFGTWFHVDGAYGGLASSLPALKNYYLGIQEADSVALDFHKWLYQPFEVGCVIVKEWSLLRKTYFRQAEYLDTHLEKRENRMEFNEHNFQLSRNAKAFKVWMSLKSYGFNKIRSMIQKDIDLTKYLAFRIRESSDFEIIAESLLAVLCFRYKGNDRTEEEIISINEKLVPALEKDGRVFITGTRLKGKFVLRACLTNHRKSKESTDFLLDTIRDVATRLD